MRFEKWERSTNTQTKKPAPEAGRARSTSRSNSRAALQTQTSGDEKHIAVKLANRTCAGGKFGVPYALKRRRILSEDYERVKQEKFYVGSLS